MEALEVDSFATNRSRWFSLSTDATSVAVIRAAQVQRDRK